MINLSEFRIGNIYLKHVGKSEPVPFIISKDILDDIYSSSYSTSWDDFSDMPISKIYLPEFGFSAGEGTFQKKINTVSKMVIQLGEKENKVEIINLGFGTSLMITHIKYMHQIQNLYQALSGEELIIN